MIGLPVKQQVLPGMEEYVCTWQCLTHCPFPGDCIWGDPDMGIFSQVEYPEHFWWRQDHSVDEQEPEPLGQVHRCNRCLSTDIDWQAEDIVCKNCGWSESLYDFPMARRH